MKHTRLTGDSVEDMSGTENLVWGFAIFYGGLLQIIAGLVEIKRNNLFGFTAFLSYGGFWMSLGTAEILVRFTLMSQTIPAQLSFINPRAVQAMLALMGIFTFVMWLCTFKQNKALCVLFFSLMMTFFLLAAGVNDVRTEKAGGAFGIITSMGAFLIAGAELINDIVGGGKEIIPLGHFDSNEFKFTGYFHVPGRVHGVTHTAVLQESHFGPGGDKPTLSVRDIGDKKNVHQDDVEQAH